MRQFACAAVVFAMFVTSAVAQPTLSTPKAANPTPAMAPRSSGWGLFSSRTSEHPTVKSYKSQAEAQTACVGDVVVWANSNSRVLHLAGNAYEQKVMKGAFMCQAAAIKAGFTMSRNGE